MLVDRVKLRLNFRRGCAAIPALATRAGDDKLAIRVSAQEDIAAGACRVAFLGRAEHAARRAAKGAANSHAYRPADKEAEAHAKASANHAAGHGVRRATQPARKITARYAQPCTNRS